MATFARGRSAGARRGRAVFEGRLGGRLPMAAAGACAVVLGLVAGTSPARRVAAQGPVLDAYQLVDVWPEKESTATGIIQAAAGLDIGPDGRVYVSDAGAGAIHVMLPTGQFLPPFGVTGTDEERVGAPGRLAVDQAANRLYVLDTSGKRVVSYDLDGNYLAQWPNVDGAAIAVGPDGRVYVADREQNAIRAFGADGASLFAFGGLGTDHGLFTGFTDVSVSPDGATIAVGDMHALRVQMFDLSPTGVVFRRSYELNAPKYGPPANGTPPWKQCRATVVHALGGDSVWVGDGSGACRLEGSSLTYVIASTAAGGAICKQTVRLPRIRPASGQYVALATYDPNDGPCYSSRGGKRTELPTSLAVVTYGDPDLLRPTGIFLASVNAIQDGGMLAPVSVSSPVSGTVFVQDSTRYGRFFAPDGAPQGAVALSTRQGLGATTRYVIELADGTDRPTEILGYYRRQHRGRQPGGTDLGVTPTPSPTALPTGSPTAAATQAPPAHDAAGSTWVEDEHGIGRFRAIQVVEHGQTIDVVEPIWTNPFELMSPERAQGREGPTASIECLDVAYNAATDEVVALISERQPKLRSEDARIVRIDAQGGAQAPSLDLPDDASTTYVLNPYVDLSVGPDGRMYALDDLGDVAQSYAPDGRPVAAIPVAADVVRLGGGPQGRLFALRESGYVERYEPDGTVGARFDGRPFATGDPETLADVAADDSGRVYVADTFASVVAVFGPADPASGIQPVPDDATCILQGDKVADPTSLILGDSTRVRLSVDGRCGIGEVPSDVVLGVLYYPQLFWGSRFRLNGTNDDPAAPIIRELRQLVSRIDLTKHRLGIVSYWTDTIVELPLTSDRSSVLSAVQKISRRWPGYGNCVLWNSRVACTSKPNVRDALRAAQGLFEPTSGRRQVIVLYQPDYCNRAFAYYDGECRGYPAAEEAAAAVRAALTEIVVFDGNRTGYRQYRFNGQPYQADAQPLASSDADAVFGYREAQHRMVRYEVPANLATQFELVDTVPDNMRLVPGSIVPPASRVGADVQWALPQLAYRPAPFQLDLTPLQPGHWPTNVQAVARFVDGWGRSGSITFPVPAVDVEWPTPTPEEPTPTVPAIAPTAVGPGPTASPGTHLYLPALVRS